MRRLPLKGFPGRLAPGGATVKALGAVRVDEGLLVEVELFAPPNAHFEGVCVGRAVARLGRPSVYPAKFS